MNPTIEDLKAKGIDTEKLIIEKLNPWLGIVKACNQKKCKGGYTCKVCKSRVALQEKGADYQPTVFFGSDIPSLPIVDVATADTPTPIDVEGQEISETEQDRQEKEQLRQQKRAQRKAKVTQV